ncbi:MAG TPA: ABC transporter ATP-binding protein [Amycolatopsis sp.]|jgi:oligopeptide/dipeptide ABC transporter ATP-binding protein|nr:ABC transporter ATP-binding protein [Amycolatopsis sp.]
MIRIATTAADTPGPATSHLLDEHPGYDQSAPALEVAGLSVAFPGDRSPITVVDDVGYRVGAGESLAVIGESGSGKSITVRAVMGILPRQARVTAGTVRLSGVDLGALDDATLRRLRGSAIAMVFQDSLSALNPVLPVGYQVAEVFRVHLGMSRKESNRRAIEMLDRVRIPSPAHRARQYPHEFSGGMRQRVMIAMALSLDPAVLIADEPTTALDVTVQAQIMELLAELRSERNMALVLISHDLGVVADTADEIAVMYGGRIVERAPASELYREPRHPYTRALLASIPGKHTRGRRLRVLPGSPPDPSRLPPGCSFGPRCPHSDEVCLTRPALQPIRPGRLTACHHSEEVVENEC